MGNSSSLIILNISTTVLQANRVGEEEDARREGTEGGTRNCYSFGFFMHWRMATVVYKRIATLLFEHSRESYSRTLHWLRCKLTFSLLHSAITCLRGFR